MVLRTQLGPVSGDLLDIVVHRIDQWPRPVPDKVVAEPVQLDELDLYALARASSARWRRRSSCQAFAAALLSVPT